MTFRSGGAGAAFLSQLGKSLEAGHVLSTSQQLGQGYGSELNTPSPTVAEEA